MKETETFQAMDKILKEKIYKAAVRGWQFGSLKKATEIVEAYYELNYENWESALKASMKLIIENVKVQVEAYEKTRGKFKGG